MYFVKHYYFIVWDYVSAVLHFVCVLPVLMVLYLFYQRLLVLVMLLRVNEYLFNIKEIINIRLILLEISLVGMDLHLDFLFLLINWLILLNGGYSTFNNKKRSSGTQKYSHSTEK